MKHGKTEKCERKIQKINQSRLYNRKSGEQQAGSTTEKSFSPHFS